VANAPPPLATSITVVVQVLFAYDATITEPSGTVTLVPKFE
jgi:hypothetical protein